MAKKEFKEIKGIPYYWACNDGTIWSTKVSYRYNPNGKIRLVRPRTHPSGYLYYGLFVGIGPNKQRLWRRGHRLVYETFVGKIKNGYEIDHIDGDKHNNKLSNLRMLTRSENMLAMYKRKKENIMKTIIEIGANDGNDTMKFVSQPDTFVYILEPHPGLNDSLETKLRVEGYENYKLFRLAASDTNGIAQFHISGPDYSHNWACSSLNEFTDDIQSQWPNRSDFASIGTILVQTIRMDEFIEIEDIQNIDYLHCDAQGSDLKILQSFGKHLDKLKAGRVEAANRVSLYKSDNSVYSVVNWLKENGFEVKEIHNHFGEVVSFDDLPNSTEEVDVYFQKL